MNREFVMRVMASRAAGGRRLAVGLVTMLVFLAVPAAGCAMVLGGSPPPVPLGLAAHVSQSLGRVKTGRLVVLISGVPAGVRPSGELASPGKESRRVVSDRFVLAHARPGRYVVFLREVTVSHRLGAVSAGARVVPATRRVAAVVKAGRTVTLTATYAGVINPNTRKLPTGLLRVIGSPSAPSGLVYRAGAAVPAVGSVLTAAPSSVLPDGLVAKVTGSTTSHGRTTLRIVEVPITDAVPEFDYSGAPVDIQSVSIASAARLRDEHAAEETGSSPCSTSAESSFTHSVEATQFEVRKASLSLFPHLKESLVLALRTTESLGIAADASLDCSWDGPTLWQWDGAIPGPFGIPIPIFGKLSLDADASATVQAGFTANLASTHVLTLDLGTRRTDDHVTFQEQGTNVWTTGTVDASGKIGANLKLTAGFGVPEIVTAGFFAQIGPEFSWDSSSGCDLALDWSAGLEGSAGESTKTLTAVSGTIAHMSPGWCSAKSTGPTGPTIPTGSISMSPIPDEAATIRKAITPVQVAVSDTYGGTLTYYPYGLTVVSSPGATPASTLPPGLTIDSTTGEISGTPSTPGTYKVTIMAADSGGPQLDNSAQRTFTWIVTPPPTTTAPNTVTITNPGDQTTTAGAGVNLQIHATDSGNAALSYTASNTSGNSTLPFGLAIDPTAGTITGQPAIAGTYTVTITVTDTTGASSNATFVWKVQGPPSPVITAATFSDQGIVLTYTPPESPSTIVDYECEASPDGGQTVYPCDGGGGVDDGIGTSDPATAPNLIYTDPSYLQIQPGWSMALAAVTDAGRGPFGPWFTLPNPLGPPVIKSAVDGSIYYGGGGAEPGQGIALSYQSPSPVNDLTILDYGCEESPDGGQTVYPCDGGGGVDNGIGLADPAIAPNEIYGYDGLSYLSVEPGWSIRIWALTDTVTGSKSDWFAVS